MYEELEKRLRAVAGGGREEKCDGCPYEEDYPCCVDCLDKLHKQAADAIHRLRYHADDWEKIADGWRKRYEEAEAALKGEKEE